MREIEKKTLFFQRKLIFYYCCAASNNQEVPTAVSSEAAGGRCYNSKEKESLIQCYQIKQKNRHFGSFCYPMHIRKLSEQIQ